MAQRPKPEPERRELGQIIAAIEAGQPVLVIGEKGIGKQSMALHLHKCYSPQRDCAIATYKGSNKKFFQSIAIQLDIPYQDEETGKDLTIDRLKEVLLENAKNGTVLIFPEAKRLTTGIRYWLEDLMSNGVVIVCFAVANPSRDIFLDMVEIELEIPSEQDIRSVMRRQAQKCGLNLSESELAELQPQAGQSPLLAKQIIKRLALGLEDEVSKHTQYINVTPLWFAFLAGFAAMKFVGMGIGDKSIQVFGGLMFMLFMSLKQLGQIKGSKKRLGQ